ncbi:glutaredoxin [Advenella kashmirensis WT001]|uniref:Glutaredoxin n=1 Tax=Advenella kashmirensis (strain DSM 17095 / LMG 22695 / WT001) TaxID=1036672 RepID=I3U8Y3_ADVKW|nr:glutaredoxin 3 [Advenella kashmirensis]AFK61471.1 glutaredoxin [Advenella kashmirensis WT001]
MKKVTMYYKQTCPYCVRAEKLLRERGVSDLEKISIDTNREQRAAMIERSGGRTTVPQIFIDQAHIGGCDDLIALDREGKLVTMLGA